MNPAEPAALEDLIDVAEQATVSRVLARSSGGSVTLFAFAGGQELSEHTAPFDALVHVLQGSLELRIGGKDVVVDPGEAALMPANIPHALKAASDSKMLLTMLRELQKE
jgi:quercetin dioxygenase-like cupin family protein